jgi:hypothetical protein
VQTLSGPETRKWLFSRIGSNRLGVTRFSILGTKPSSSLENLAASQGEFEALRRSHQKVILKHRPGALQRAANRRLAQPQPRCGRSDAFLLRNRGKCNQEVQIDLS